MKRLLAAAVAVAALAAAAPASADPSRIEQRQSHDRGYDRNDSYRGDYRDSYDPRDGYRHDERRFSREDLARLQQRIDWGFQSGRLNRHEARRLNWQLAELRDRARSYWRTDGISWRERRDLEDRYAYLRHEVRRQMHDDDYRGGWRG